MPLMAKAAVAGLLTGLLGLLLSLLPMGLALEENIGLHMLFTLRGPREVPAHVVIVTVDRISAERLDIPRDPEKWPRAMHARLTEILAGRGASVIVFDMIFNETRPGEEDELFAAAIGRAKNVVLGELLKTEIVSARQQEGKAGSLRIERVVPPADTLARAALALAPFPLPKIPVKVSQYWTFKRGAGDRPTLPVVAFQIFALASYQELIHRLKEVGAPGVEKLPSDGRVIIRHKHVEWLIRTLRDLFQNEPSVARRMMETSRKPRDGPSMSGENRMLTALLKMYQSPSSRYLNFYGPPGTIPTICYYEVLQDHERSAAGHQPLDFRGKAVFVGLSERLRPEQKDGFYTVFSQPTGVDMSGVEIAATAFANLSEDMHVQPLKPYTHNALILIWGVLLGILSWILPAPIAAGTIVGLGVLYLMAIQQQFTEAGTWYPLVFPLFFQVPLAFFGTVVWKHFETNRERNNIRRAFGYYLPDEVVDRLAKNIAEIKTSSEIVYGTCLFTDAERYTALSETMEPKALSDFMGRYYEALFRPVKAHGGIVINVVGDSMLALWTGLPSDAAFRKRACLAALDIVQGVKRFNRSSGELELPIRVGIHCGQILLRNVGALDHYEYRPTGDIVNTASRMESLNKYLGTQILVSEEVLDHLSGFLTRDLGRFRPAGKSNPISVHELMCPMEECDNRQKGLCEAFAKALRAFWRQSWDEAIGIFQGAGRVYGKDGPCEFYIRRCEAYKAAPPGDGWDGVVSLDRK